MSNFILTEVKSGNCNLGIITLNRAEKLNALNFQMLKDITNILLQWKDDNKIDAVVIKSDTPKAFCAGGDIKYIYENGPKDIDKSINFFQNEYALNHLIFNYPKPYIALLHGISMGGGLGISLHGSFRIANQNLKLAMPEAKIGFFTDIGGTYFLSKLQDYLGIYMALTGGIINADTAKHYSLVDCVLNEEEYLSVIDTLLEQSKLELSDLKNIFKSQHDDNIFTPSNDFQNACKENSFVKFLHVLEDNSIKEKLEGLSPLSLSISYHAQKNAPLSFEECIITEFCLTQEYIRDTEFYEGIKALMVEKTKPHWTYSLQDVTEDVIYNYFTRENKKRLEFHEI